MPANNALVEKTKGKNGLRKIINSLTEFVKSRINKDYILTDNSPDFLRKNRNLILKTIKKNPYYLDKVDEGLLIEELIQSELPTDGIIDTAFKNIYKLNKDSIGILKGTKAKNVIMQYIKLKNTSLDNISSALACLDKDVFSDTEFKEELFDIALKRGWSIRQNSPEHLRHEPKLAENYYIKLLENNGIITNDKSILDATLINNTEFVQKYIKLLSSKGITNDEILKTLMYNGDCANALKNNAEVFKLVFEQVTPTNLEEFFNTLYKDRKELDEFFANDNNFQGKLSRLSKLYNRDSEILKTLDSRLLDEKYANIPAYKMQIIGADKQVQEQILSLTDYQYMLYSKMVQCVAQKTDRWNRFDYCILDNLADGYYVELVDDLYEQANQGNKITAKDIETLTFLCSKSCHNRSVFESYADDLRREGTEELIIKQKEIAHSNNVFNIKNKKELEHYEEIKEMVCDTVLTDPSLADTQLTSAVSKYLGQFKQLPELDRIKLALLEKYYNMDLKEASDIVKNFSGDIENVHADDEEKTNIKEQLKAIKNIFASNDITTLQQVAELDTLVKTDLAVSTYLIEQSKEMFEKIYEERLYTPKENEKIGTTIYDEKNIDVFETNTDFEMIVKTIVPRFEEDSKEKWNSLRSQVTEKGGLRYKTCTSYMTPENILKKDDVVILGFSEGLKGYSFEAMFPKDAHSSFYGDSVYTEKYNGSSFVMPETLETDTKGDYNEIVINTLKLEADGKMTKLQPDYVVYIKKKTSLKLNDLESDEVWLKTKKVASDFDIPIVIVDKEKVRENEKEKISTISEGIISEIKKGRIPSSKELVKFVSKAEHYKSRYSADNVILEHAPADKLAGFKEYAKQKEEEEKREVAIPKVASAEIEKIVKQNRQNVLRKQKELAERKIITGDER